jgi:carbamoyltransferase
MKASDIGAEQIIAWLATYDYPLPIAARVRTVFEEFPASLRLIIQDHAPAFDGTEFREGICAPERIGRLFGVNHAVPVIGMLHHDNHACFSYLVSPFSRDEKPVMIVIDGSGDNASISFYLGQNGAIRQIRTNDSIFDSIGMFYAIISSTQGGWTVLSSEGRYMGAAAFGDTNRSSNRFYAKLRNIFGLQTVMFTSIDR